MQIGSLYSRLPSRTARLHTILSLALPMTAGMLSQSLLNLVDTAMVGHLGDQALAAVALANYAIFVCFGLISGLSIAVQAQVAHNCGASQTSHLITPVTSGMAIAGWIGFPLSLCLAAIAPTIVQSFQPPADIAPLAISYFRLRILSLPAGILLLTYRGFWNGCHSPLIYLRTLVCIHIINALLSYTLIFGIAGMEGLGLIGAAAGTVIAMYAGVIANAIQLKGFARRHQLLSPRTHWTEIKRLGRKALPDSLQQTLFAFGGTALFWLIARMGSEAMAISHVLITICLVLILPGIGLGMAATTLIHQALGARQPERAWRWGLEIVGVACAALGLLSLPLIFLPERVLALFVPDNPLLIAHGAVPLQLAGLGIVLESAALVLIQALIGTGRHRTVLMIRFGTLWLLGLPLTGIGIIWFDLSLTGVWVLQVLQKAMTSLLCLWVWQQRKRLTH